MIKDIINFFRWSSPPIVLIFFLILLWYFLVYILENIFHTDNILVKIFQIEIKNSYNKEMTTVFMGFQADRRIRKMEGAGRYEDQDCLKNRWSLKRFIRCLVNPIWIFKNNFRLFEKWLIYFCKKKFTVYIIRSNPSRRFYY